MVGISIQRCIFDKVVRISKKFIILSRYFFRIKWTLIEIIISLVLTAINNVFMTSFV